MNRHLILVYARCGARVDRSSGVDGSRFADGRGRGPIVQILATIRLRTVIGSLVVGEVTSGTTSTLRSWTKFGRRFKCVERHGQLGCRDAGMVLGA